MPRQPAVLTSQTRISDYLTISLMYRDIPDEKIRLALKKTGKSRIRFRHLPREMLPSYIIAMSLFRNCSLNEVQNIFFEGTTWAMKANRGFDSDQIRAMPVSKSAISQARTNLGWEPMKTLFDDVVYPEIGNAGNTIQYNDWFLVSLSGGTVETVNSLENYHEFNSLKLEGKNSSSPQMRFISLVEHGSRLIFAAEVGASTANDYSLAKDVVPFLRKEMLCFAGKSFFNFELWQEAVKTGAGLVWEIEKEVNINIIEKYTDGSFLATLTPRNNGLEPAKEDLNVRIIKYRPSYTSTEKHYLITNLLDYENVPAIELASLYHDRLAVEEASDIIQTLHSVKKIALRSKTPDLVRQEFFGLLLAVFILRKVVSRTYWGKLATSRDIVNSRLCLENE